MTRTSLVILAVSCCVGLLRADTPVDEHLQQLRELDAGGPFRGTNSCSTDSTSLPLVQPVLGAAGDGWPSKVRITGRVVGLLPGVCGIACNAASLWVEVTQASKHLPAQHVFVFTWCIRQADAARYCGRSIRFTASKLLDPEKHCGIRNSFNSNGSPYFIVQDADSEIEVLPAQRSADGAQAPNPRVNAPHSVITPLAQGGKRRAAGRARHAQRWADKRNAAR